MSFFNKKYYSKKDNEPSKAINMPKNLNTYLGQKGYTILKSELQPTQIQYIKEQLLIKPCTPGAPIAIDKSYPVYRESDKKIYVPRYYGTELFGPPKETKITEGDDILLEFQGTLRDQQVPVVQKYMETVTTSLNGINGIGGGGLLELPCGFGKCLGINTPIMMSNGTFKMVQDIQIGDKLMGDNSTPRNVLSLARGKEQMYKISSKNGDEYIVNESHILSLKCSTDCDNMKKGQIVDISVKDFLELSKTKLDCPLLGYKVPILFPKVFIDINPYLFGCWIGNQKSSVEQNIPVNYKCNSRTIQLQLLAGIIDSDNGYNKGNYYEIISQNNTQLADDIVFLCRSLGFACYITNKHEDTIVIHVYGSGLEQIPLLCLEKKYVTYSQCLDDALVYKITVEKLDIDDYYGFEIDGNKRFVLGDFSVTHNTSISLHIISKLKKKTLVIVHYRHFLK
jgi:hypothetical protein